MGAWALQGDLREALETEADEIITEYYWKHEDVDIPKPQTPGPRIQQNPDFYLYFDGAFKGEGGGAGGTILLDVEGELIHAEG